MIDAGIFDEDEHVELLHGRLVVVPPQGPPHSYTSTVLRDRLMKAFPAELVREAKPLDCGAQELPEPDLCVVRGTAQDFEDRDPRGDETLLVVEVSRTTQRIDRDKTSVYAGGGAPVYWLVDLVARRVEAHREPIGDRYRRVEVVGDQEELPVPHTELRWRVSELLPRE